MAWNYRRKKYIIFTNTILQSIDYKDVKLLRERNFLFLHFFLAKYNLLDIDICSLDDPMVYPFLWKDPLLRDELLKNKVYLAMYWSEVLKRVTENSVEASFVNEIFPLPIDQRYELSDMYIIVDLIKKYIKEKGT